jgi:Flp pilus assembly protein TadB
VIIGTHLLNRVRHARRVFSDMQIKSPTYLRVFHQDVIHLREELLRSAVGLSVGASAGLLFVGFASMATLVTVWDTRARVAVAWALTLAWAIVAASGLGYARRALRAGKPFPNFIPLVQRDLAALEKEPT